MSYFPARWDVEDMPQKFDYSECQCCGSKFSNEAAISYIKKFGMCQTCDEQEDDVDFLPGEFDAEDEE